MPSANCYFLLVFTPQNIPIKRSPNAAKLFGDFFGPEDNLGAKEGPEGRPVGTTRHQGAPWWVMGPMGVSCTASSPYKFPNISETLGESTKHNFNRHKFQNHEIQCNTITEGFIILIGASRMMREYFTIDLRVRKQ